MKRDHYFADAARDGYEGASSSDKNGMGEAEAIVLSQWLLEEVRVST